ncbi:septal ring lytic transglycosylase RlpA family protein [Neorhizobium sp. P12A]|uniref:septal ring lytic transglycosylase RlpA family protein n=1 Tax=Rhizobium/Agrobacterium group TaxID=227290 RepID=UPI00104AD233|nr:MULTISPECIES: septal ring lytic transglycosylase RlpA family protein [Rhizobium/Agrobacterium group]KAA0697382.1 septal ring lytic transglycosylase RlpA family protein [Neorhizobium sp. P12A]TCR82264.1 rare lipoprotein A [Rhizobium sp. BK376]
MKFENGAVTFATGIRWAAISVMCATVTACGTTHGPVAKKSHGKEYFSESEYGVKASPRVAYGNNIPKGGGRYMLGNPYAVKGKWYYPKEDYSYNKVGIASWYGDAFHGRLTANGEVYDQLSLTAAHPTFPLPSYARVTNVENGSSIIVRVNDRGPYHPGRIIDLSNKTADMLDLKDSGTGDVRVQYVGKAPLDGHDQPYLMASYIPKGSRLPGLIPGGQIATGVMVASNSKRITADELPDYAPTPYRAPRRTTAALAPAAVPVPATYSQTAYAGSTPTSSYGRASSAQAPTLVWGGQTPAPVPQAAPAQQQQYTPSAQGAIILPVFGPIPYERPDSFRGAVPMASLDTPLEAAYQEAPVKTVTVQLAFDAVMVRNDGLTQDSILSSYRRQHEAKTQAD